jgi:hypothetical protein
MRSDSKHMFDDVIDPKMEGASRRKRDEISNKRESKSGANIVDPVRCPMCLTVLQCPRNKDYEVYIAEKNLRCLSIHLILAVRVR